MSDHGPGIYNFLPDGLEWPSEDGLDDFVAFTGS
jgi:hypothetical protein